MSVEKRFRDGSNRETVFNVLKEAETNKQTFPGSRVIAERVGLSFERVRRARADLFRDGYLETPTPEQWRESIASTRGSIVPDIRPYAQLGMSPAEIQEAIVQERGLDRGIMPITRIANALSHVGRTDQPLRRRTKEEIREIRAEVLRRTPEQLQRRVQVWLQLKNIFAGLPPDQLPQTRSEWLFLIADRERDETAGWRLVREIDPDSLEQLNRYVTVLRRRVSANELVGIMVQNASSSRETKLARLFLDKGLVKPDTTYWECLRVIYQEQERTMPTDFADRIRLEVFLAAILQRKRGSIKLIDRYRQLGETVGAGWFTSTLREEELFIEQDIDLRNLQRVNRLVPARSNIS
ncbi:hypothetical protein HYU96_03715 [Candidatus Daviesbacteria bacterium]|nr:hypothetical protein [Candidatus Daviesbacteria bacterium]